MIAYLLYKSSCICTFVSAGLQVEHRSTNQKAHLQPTWQLIIPIRVLFCTALVPVANMDLHQSNEIYFEGSGEDITHEDRACSH